MVLAAAYDLANHLMADGAFGSDADQGHPRCMSKADKAVFIAAEAKKAAGLDTLILDLTVINHEVKAPVASCVKHGLALKFSIADQGAPALAWCRENGYKTWREVDLTELIEQ